MFSTIQLGCCTFAEKTVLVQLQKDLGDKQSLEQLIYEITEIPVEIRGHLPDTLISIVARSRLPSQDTRLYFYCVGVICASPGLPSPIATKSSTRGVNPVSPGRRWIA